MALGSAAEIVPGLKFKAALLGDSTESQSAEARGTLLKGYKQ